MAQKKNITLLFYFFNQSTRLSDTWELILKPEIFENKQTKVLSEMTNFGQYTKI